MRYAPLPSESNETGQNQQHPAPNVPQIGYAIGKKVGNAVVRNRIRRRLRPIIVAEALNLAPGVYLIGVKNDQAAQISHDELHDDLRTTLAAASRAPR